LAQAVALQVGALHTPEEDPCTWTWALRGQGFGPEVSRA